MRFTNADFYAIVLTACNRHGERKGYGNKIVSLSLSYDGFDWVRYNIFVEYSNFSFIIETDFWEGEKYMELHWIINIDSIAVPEGLGIYVKGE